MISAILFAVSLMSQKLVLTHGKIWTGDPNRRFVEAVAIEGNTIVAIGSNEEMTRIAGDAKQIDLHGRVAVPGFIDNHVHFVDGGFELSRVRLRDAASPDEFARRISEHARKLGKGKWVLGGEWDQTIWNPITLPTKQMIDAVTRDNPVLVSRLDGHMALANSVALKLAGITRDSKDPAGGTIVRDANGEPTGLLKDNAMSPVFAIVPAPSTEERMAAARAGLREAARFGVTAFCDMSGGDAYDDLRAYQRLDKGGELTARVYLFTPISEYRRLVDASIEKGFGSDVLRIGGLKGFADGSLGSATAAMFEPFSDDAKNRGLTMEPVTNGSLKKWVADADANDLQVAIHAIGDRANDEILKIYESIPNGGRRRFRIEHAQHLNPALIRRFANDHVIASMQPYHAIDDGRWAEQKIGPERAKGTYAFRSLIDAGVTLTFGSDWTVAPLNPLLGVYAAVTRRTIDGRNPDGWIPAEKISIDEALKSYTVNNAYAMFMENEIGRIGPGLRADIVILSDDLFSIAPEKIEGVQIDLTLFDGRVIYERK
ncbi:MAG: putative metal-dependent hydrolase [Acidobacteria bacterium]|nr:putative metal-dependent hydrolase [Acidobacteriota bacterium]